jgi:hypothetical protein
MNYFSSLYATNPHNQLKCKPFQVIHTCFLNENGTRKYKFLVVGKQDTYFVRHHSDNQNKYSEAYIIDMLDFLVENIYVVLGVQIFQQSIGILMGTNCVLYWKTYSYIHMRQNLSINCYRIVSTTKNTSNRILQPNIQIHRWCPINQQS